MTIAWIISIAISVYAGYHYQKLQTTVRKLSELVLSLQTRRRRIEEAEAKAVIIDPENVIQMAKYEQDELIKSLNE